MKRFFKTFLDEDRAQDLVEYTLLVAFVALTTAGLFIGSGANVSQTWSSANSVLTTAAGAQPSSDSGGGSGSGGGGSQSGGGGSQGGDGNGGNGGGHDHGGDGGRH
jgi:Flp pilus assembly pilin Flp